MDLEIPDGEIVDNDLNLVAKDDLGEVVALWASGRAFSYLGSKLGRYDAELLDIRLAVDGLDMLYSFYVLELPRPTLVVAMTRGSKLAFVLFRDDAPPHWSVSTKVLLLPGADDVPGWSEGDRMFENLYSRVLLFAGLASLNQWYRPLLPEDTQA